MMTLLELWSLEHNTLLCYKKLTWLTNWEAPAYYCNKPFRISTYEMKIFLEHFVLIMLTFQYNLELHNPNGLQ